ncbi:hypothetical protein PGAL8A_00449100 [Plasmodium gallinaceum]|uniref:Uncharacterized protein n=1 Tax=Plasmodium gallinaceum TaxID=5849 RepID=A0A1J1GX76_PLAGA|nr:hypothetical protein PGAL8A_00449100 [Plasmodium gallinaceum]CRG96910.1 hypothetical protein PGAL8A_00449100 [Plasmodium gallinaceum]
MSPEENRNITGHMAFLNDPKPYKIFIAFSAINIIPLIIGVILIIYICRICWEERGTNYNADNLSIDSGYGGRSIDRLDII